MSEIALTTEANSRETADLAGRGGYVVRQAANKIEHIAASVATKVQAVTANEIADHVESISTMTEQTNAATQSNAAAADQLNMLAVKLKQDMDYFKV